MREESPMEQYPWGPPTWTSVVEARESVLDAERRHQEARAALSRAERELADATDDLARKQMGAFQRGQDWTDYMNSRMTAAKVSA